MKLKSLLVSLLAVSALVACNKENDGGAAAPTDGNGITVTVAIRTSNTRAVVDDGFTEDQSAITLTSAMIYFADGANGNIVDKRVVETDNLSEAQVFHSVNPSATHAIIAANYGSLLTSTPATVAALKATTLDLSTVTDLASVPLMSGVGELVENADGTHTPAEGEEDATIDYRKVSLTVAPVLARIEIGGTLAITSSVDEGKFVYQNFTSKYVGLNGLYGSCTLDGTASVGDQTVANSNADGFPDVGTTPAWMYDAFQGSDSADLIADADQSISLLKVYAYNVMPGDKPEITLQFDSTPISVDDLPEGYPFPPSPKAYIKIVNFSKDGATETLEAGKIYKISNITFDQEKVTLLDNKVLCVEVSIEVTPWTVKDVDPEFGE